MTDKPKKNLVKKKRTVLPPHELTDSEEFFDGDLNEAEVVSVRPSTPAESIPKARTGSPGSALPKNTRASQTAKPEAKEPTAGPPKTRGLLVLVFFGGLTLGVVANSVFGHIFTPESKPVHPEPAPLISAATETTSSPETAVAADTIEAIPTPSPAPTASAAPRFDCVAMSTNLLQEYFTQNNPAAFRQPNSHQPGTTYIKCKKGDNIQNPDGTNDVSACKICTPGN
ncbi:MAG: hypothetical protein ABIB04_01085 [Patescibacteria group bacterium]